MAGKVKIIFGIGETSNIGSVNIPTLIGNIESQVVESRTPFLLSIRDINRLYVHFNNLTNVLVHHDKKVPVVRKFGHLFILLNSSAEAITY